MPDILNIKGGEHKPQVGQQNSEFQSRVPFCANTHIPLPQGNFRAYLSKEFVSFQAEPPDSFLLARDTQINVFRTNLEVGKK